MHNLPAVSRHHQVATVGDIKRRELEFERLMERGRIAVIYAGNKAEPGAVLFQSSNVRSWKSYEAVAADIAASLCRTGFRHVQLLQEDMHLGTRLAKEKIDFAWLNTGGVQGYNSIAHASAVLEMLGVPYVGHDPLSATTLDNKHAFKREAVCAGLPTASFSVWDCGRGKFKPFTNSRFRQAFGDYTGPFVVKPVSGRASLHVQVVDTISQLPDVVEETYCATANTVLIEQYLPGREFCVAVAGPVTARNKCLHRATKPFAFGALERTFAPGERIFTSMDFQPITKERFVTLKSAENDDLIWRLHQLACQVFLEFNLRSLVRLDVRADEAGELYILEANPKPDLKQPGECVTSLISEGLAECNMSYDDLVYSLIADRLDFLLTHRRETVAHLSELFAAPAVRSTGGNGGQSDARGTAKDQSLAMVNELGADLQVQNLAAVLAAERGTRPPPPFPAKETDSLATVELNRRQVA
jgi:D-alanine-D-alanine ligase